MPVDHRRASFTPWQSPGPEGYNARMPYKAIIIVVALAAVALIVWAAFFRAGTVAPPVEPAPEGAEVIVY